MVNLSIFKKMTGETLKITLISNKNRDKIIDNKIVPIKNTYLIL